MPRSGDALHESFARDKEVAGSSNRTFGLVFAGFFVILAALSWWHDGHRWPWYVGIGAAFAAVALTVPGILAPLNRIWTAFGLLLHKVINPIIMGIVFFGVVTPLALLMRVLGKRPLDLRYKDSDQSYWKRRPVGDQKSGAMSRQF